MQTTGLMILTDNLVNILTSSGKFTNAFPGFKQIAAKHTRKRENCNCGKKVDMGKIVKEVKEHIIGMTPDKQIELKKLLGTLKIIMYIYTADGRRQRVEV